MAASVEASLVKLGDIYALVPRPLPEFINNEDVVMGNGIRLFDEVDDKAKIEGRYIYHHMSDRYWLEGGDSE